MNIPGVVGVDIGECDKIPCIKVYLEKETPESKNIPKQLEVFKVDVEITGPIGTLEILIESTSLSSGLLGTEVIIRGKNFTPSNNDITFTSPKINFQGRSTGYLNGIASPDGKTLRFNLPDNNNVLLSACPF
jgi:hypothetical protein